MLKIFNPSLTKSDKMEGITSLKFTQTIKSRDSSNSVKTRKESMDKTVMKPIKHSRTESYFYLQKTDSSNIIKERKAKSKSVSLDHQELVKNVVIKDPTSIFFNKLKIEDRFKNDAKKALLQASKAKHNCVFLINIIHDAFYFVGLYNFSLQNSSFSKLYSPYQNTPQLFGLYKIKKSYCLKDNSIKAISCPVENKKVIKAITI